MPVKNFKAVDTTLRDGEQTPGVAFSPQEKLEIARELDDLGIGIIEVGSSPVSKGESEAISKIVEEGLDAEILSFCRGMKSDIDSAIECGVNGIHLVIPLSALHIKKKLGKSREEIIEMSRELTMYALDHGLKVKFSGEDSTRADPEFVSEIFSLTSEEGADSTCVCDTVGVARPEKIYDLISRLSSEVEAPLAVHCHDDFGLATANTLFALKAGAEEAHLTVNGIGERGGNAALEEVVTALSELYDYRLDLDFTKLYEISKMVEKYSGQSIPSSKALVGENTFAHEAGIHVDGMIKDSSTYEPISPEKVGRERRFVVGKHSGKHAVRDKLKKEGIEAEAGEKEVKEIFKRIKEIGDSGESVDEERWEKIVEKVLKKD